MLKKKPEINQLVWKVHDGIPMQFFVSDAYHSIGHYHLKADNNAFGSAYHLEDLYDTLEDLIEDMKKRAKPIKEVILNKEYLANILVKHGYTESSAKSMVNKLDREELNQLIFSVTGKKIDSKYIENISKKKQSSIKDVVYKGFAKLYK